mmetsp:Transcript_86442/g.217646  ORF Transcript_86442/g.217646 Transcript_86442/m.217646 type:complete len:206 (+) Transcript_86442:297-914(+)
MGGLIPRVPLLVRPGISRRLGCCNGGCAAVALSALVPCIPLHWRRRNCGNGSAICAAAARLPSVRLQLLRLLQEPIWNFVVSPRVPHRLGERHDCVCLAVVVVVPSPNLVHGNERRRYPSMPNASSTADPLHVHVNAVGKVIVQNLAHPADVEASRGNVCSDHDVNLAFAELHEICLPLVLPQVPMQRPGVHLVLPQLLVQALRL